MLSSICVEYRRYCKYCPAIAARNRFINESVNNIQRSLVVTKPMKSKVKFSPICFCWLQRNVPHNAGLLAKTHFRSFVERIDILPNVKQECSTSDLRKPHWPVFI